MTDFQKSQIYSLRLQGVGYKAISNIIGVSADSVKKFCQRNNLRGPQDVVNLNVEIMKDENLICSNCHRVIKQNKRGRSKKFCSDYCRKEWWNKNKDKKNKNKSAIYKCTCENCGREFESYGNQKRKFCSHDCYIKSRFWEVENGT
jgi:protein-arginine kinase activator protein McsA